MNVTFTKAELFAIRYSINYATQIQDIAYIIIIMDATLATKCIFDMTIHSYQLYSITISNCWAEEPEQEQLHLKQSWLSLCSMKLRWELCGAKKYTV